MANFSSRPTACKSRRTPPRGLAQTQWVPDNLDTRMWGGRTKQGQGSLFDGAPRVPSTYPPPRTIDSDTCESGHHGFSPNDKVFP